MNANVAGKGINHETADGKGTTITAGLTVEVGGKVSKSRIQTTPPRREEIKWRKVQRSREEIEDDQRAELKRKADQLILDAERSKAQIDRPSDESKTSCNSYVRSQGEIFYPEDYLFQHFSAHVEKSLQDKIKRSKFVHLSKLLPKNDKTRSSDGDPKLEMVNKNGYTFLVPALEKELPAGIVVDFGKKKKHFKKAPF